MIFELFGIVAPTFICAAVGFTWVRLGVNYDRKMITDLIMNVGAPCLVFSKMVGLAGGTDEFVLLAGISMLAMALSGAGGWLLLRAMRLPSRTYLSPLIFGNTGNMGMPLCLFALGEEGLALGLAFFATHSITHFTVGVAIWSGRFSWREPLTNPLALAGAIAIAVLWSGVSVPGFITDTTGLLGDFTIPLMLITLGVSIGEMHVSNFSRTLVLASARLLMGGAVGVLLAGFFELEGISRSVVIIQCAMPAAVFNYLMAQRYDRAPEEVASLVVLSTLLAFAALPAWLAFAL
ncbi:MAG: AEC family transporter [bacterium]|nr:AEC family transporter [bacterium]